MPIAIVDSSCLIALERIDQLHLIPAVFSELIAPVAVVREFGREPDWLSVREVEDQALLIVLQTQLDPGEAEVLALALECEHGIVLNDERKARRLAHQMGLRTTGTLGILLLAKRKGFIPSVRSLMDALIQADFRIADALYAEALRLAEE